MNEALSNLADLWVPAWGLALLHFVWQGLLIGAAAGLLLALLRGAGPRSRYAVCGVALLLCLLLPLLQSAWILDQAIAPLALQQALELELGRPAWWQALQQWLPELVLAWSLGVALMALRLGLGLAWVARVRQRAQPADAAWQARLDSLATRLHLRGPVALRLWDGLASPLTIGWWRPMVLLPAALLSGMPAALLEALLAHELAHVRRLDYLVNLLQSLVEALLFFHPVVWWLSGRMRKEREQIADEIAAEALGEPRRLALALHALSQLQSTDPMPTPSLSLSARGGDLLQRIHRLAAPGRPTSSWKLALPALALACSSLFVQAQAKSPSAKPGATQTTATETTAQGDSGAAFKLAVNAKHALVLEDATGRVLMAKDADQVVPIASLTKLVTAMVVLDAKLDMNEKIRIAPEDVDTLKHSASRVRVGTEMSRLAALKMALMASENRAAAALGRTFPGGMAAFVQAAQAKVRSLGLTRTAIAEPTGLSPANTSTATEVAKIANAAARYSEISKITSDKKASVPLNGKPRDVNNTNRLVGAKGWDIRLSKTGYTEEAGRCLTMRLMSGGKPVTVVLLDADGSAQRLRDAARIRQSLAKLHS